MNYVGDVGDNGANEEKDIIIILNDDNLNDGLFEISYARALIAAS